MADGTRMQRGPWLARLTPVKIIVEHRRAVAALSPRKLNLSQLSLLYAMLPPGVADWMGERRAEIERWPEERLWALKNLDALGVQLTKIIVATKPDGTWAFTKRNARQFSALGKKDFVSAAMYCYAAFLMWLQSDSWRSRVAPEDAVGFSGWSGNAAANPGMLGGQHRIRR